MRGGLIFVPIIKQLIYNYAGKVRAGERTTDQQARRERCAQHLPREHRAHVQTSWSLITTSLGCSSGLPALRLLELAGFQITNEIMAVFVSFHCQT